jgi:hypothetical protein
MLEIDHSPNLAKMLWDLAITILLLAYDGWFEGRWETSARTLSRILDIWPEMKELLKANDKAVEVLWNMLRSEKREWQASSLEVLLRIDDEWIGENLPCSGKVGDERISVLKRMDGWILKWERRKRSFHEKELSRMNWNEWMSLGDIVRWKSFVDCMESWDHDVRTVRRDGARCKLQ